MRDQDSTVIGGPRAINLKRGVGKGFADILGFDRWAMEHLDFMADDADIDFVNCLV